VLLKFSSGQLINETSELKRFENWQQMKYQHVSHCDCGYVVVVQWGRHSGRRSPRPQLCTTPQQLVSRRAYGSWPVIGPAGPRGAAPGRMEGAIAIVHDRRRAKVTILYRIHTHCRITSANLQDELQPYEQPVRVLRVSPFLQHCWTFIT